GRWSQLFGLRVFDHEGLGPLREGGRGLDLDRLCVDQLAAQHQFADLVFVALGAALGLNRGDSADANDLAVWTADLDVDHPLPPRGLAYCHGLATSPLTAGWRWADFLFWRRVHGPVTVSGDADQLVWTFEFLAQRGAQRLECV